MRGLSLLRQGLAAWLLAACAAVPAASTVSGEVPIAPAPRAPDPSAPLYAQLPSELRKTGLLRFVGDSHPPYRIVSDDRRITEGIDFDLAQALGRVLGLPIRHYVVDSLSATLAGLEAGRYDIALGPGVATLERQVRFDGVSWLYTKPSFVYPLGRPVRYQRIEDLCGRKLSFVAGSVSERVALRISERCLKNQMPAVVQVPLVDGNMTLVATQAGRADAAAMTLTAALHAQQVSPQLFAVFGDPTNALGIDLVGLVVTKRSGLGPLLL